MKFTMQQYGAFVTRHPFIDCPVIAVLAALAAATFALYQ